MNVEMTRPVPVGSWGRVAGETAAEVVEVVEVAEGAEAAEAAEVAERAQAK